jgi:hypothetical protein
MRTINSTFFCVAAVLIFAFQIAACSSLKTSNTNTVVLEPPQENATIKEIAYKVLNNIKPEELPPERYIRGIHLSAWVSGPEKHRNAVMELLESTELNTAVIDIKEYEGQVYIDGVKLANENKTYFNAIKNVEKYITALKEKEIYTIARLVVFRDNVMPRKQPKWAVKNPDGTLWTDKKGITWLDPYSKDAQEYTLQIAERAADIGFDEIQFDYIRFPSDGNTSKCRYLNKDHSPDSASQAIVDFLKAAKERLSKKGVKLSIDVFGATTTSETDMGIGQKIVEMTEQVDYVSPMVYPSHYSKGSYGIADPNKAPYKTVYTSMEGALKRIPVEKMRPWLQDFTMGFKYDARQIRDQIQACYDNGVGSWLLWNPRCVYTKSALKDNDAETVFEKSDPPTQEMIKTSQSQSEKETDESKETSAQHSELEKPL